MPTEESGTWSTLSSGHLSTHQERITQLDEQIKPLVDFETAARSASVEIDRRLTAPARHRTAVPRAACRQRVPRLRRPVPRVARVPVPRHHRPVRARRRAGLRAGDGVAGGADHPRRPGQDVPAAAAAVHAADAGVQDAAARRGDPGAGHHRLGGAARRGTTRPGSTSSPRVPRSPSSPVVNGSANVPLEVVAGWIQYTRQLAQDSEAFRVLLNSGLTRGLLRELEEKIAAAITARHPPELHRRGRRPADRGGPGRDGDGAGGRVHPDARA